MLPVPVFFEDETAEIMLQVQLNDKEWQKITATAQSREQLEKSLHLVKSTDLGRYLFGANAQTYLQLNRGTLTLPLEWKYQGLRYQVLEQSGLWQCSAYPLKSNE